ncbi:MAG: hypothetical protein JEZ06_12545 [Anaerolineaceae bacterium]|nr:hypothetical protein [Anaerolineaceae bacterium]
MNSIPLRPRDLGLILSYQCQAQCAHCVYNCGKTWTDWISEENISQAFAALHLWDPVPMVHLTGGEPFLNYSLLLHAVQCADEFNIPCYLETNAGWALSEKIAMQKFSTLKDAGLLAVLISCSPFHAESIPPKNTINAIQASRAVFGPAQTFVYQSEWLQQITSFGVEHTTPLSRYMEEAGIQRCGELFWKGYGLISGGRAGYYLGELIAKQPAESFMFQSCENEILFSSHSHFDLYGNFIPGFCGGLSLGDWHELSELVTNYQNGELPELINLLIQNGPFGLFELAKKSGYTALSAGYAGKCHLCVDVRRFLSRLFQYPELQPAGFYNF